MIRIGVLRLGCKAIIQKNNFLCEIDPRKVVFKSNMPKGHEVIIIESLEKCTNSLDPP